MTQTSVNLSELLAAAADRAGSSLLHVVAECRRGGSGSVFNEQGVILSTARAVAGRDRVEVVQGDESRDARVVGYDAATDVGVLRVDSPIGAPAPWSDSPLRLGALVLVASRPGRTLRVRLGVVSQVDDAWLTPRGGRIERYVEVDLAPEPGFSGGLGFDPAGRALGMASAGLLRGSALFIERPTLERLVGSILTHGRVRRGYLGVGTQAVRLPDAAVSGAQKSGLLVASVQAGSAADKGGILLGDVLLKLGADPLTSAGALQSALETAEGQTLSLALWRAGKPLSFDVTPGARR